MYPQDTPGTATTPSRVHPLDQERVVRLKIDPDEVFEDDDDEEIPDSDKLPVTVVTGFLGARRGPSARALTRPHRPARPARP